MQGPIPELRELIATCSSQSIAQEFAQVKADPDEAVLRKQVERFRHKEGGVAPHMELDYFINSLRRYA